MVRIFWVYGLRSPKKSCFVLEKTLYLGCTGDPNWCEPRIERHRCSLCTSSFCNYYYVLDQLWKEKHDINAIHENNENKDSIYIE